MKYDNNYNNENNFSIVHSLDSVIENLSSNGILKVSALCEKNEIYYISVNGLANNSNKYLEILNEFMSAAATTFKDYNLNFEPCYSDVFNLMTDYKFSLYPCIVTKNKKCKNLYYCSFIYNRNKFNKVLKQMSNKQTFVFKKYIETEPQFYCAERKLINYMFNNNFSLNNAVFYTNINPCIRCIVLLKNSVFLSNSKIVTLKINKKKLNSDFFTLTINKKVQ